MNIRNIAIIAHVDHGKTILVDKLIYACKANDDRNQSKEPILDNNDLERKRITILSKNVSVSTRIPKSISLIRLDMPILEVKWKESSTWQMVCYC